VSTTAAAIRLNPDKLRASAIETTGFADWGEGDFSEALERLCRSAVDEAGLTEQGLESFAGRIDKALTTRLLLIADRARFPEIAQQEIKAPLIVAGLPRSGTTILHALLAQDPAVRSPQKWEVDEPSPPPRAESYTTDPRIAKSQAGIDALPDKFKAMHAMGATLPDECNSVMMMAFLSPNFGASASIPSYMRWLVGEADMTPAFAIHRAMLQNLQAFAPGQNWVLKAPPYLWWIDDLFRAYPDARLVITHRDPSEVIPSNSSLIAFLQSLSAPVDPLAVGQEQAEIWGLGIDRLLVARAAGQHNDRIMDSQYQDFIADPMQVVRSVYARFNIPLTDTAVAAMGRFMAENQQGKHGKHEYEAEDYGLNRAALRERFANYIQTFSIPVKQ
jgi:hypothetical protein